MIKFKIKKKCRLCNSSNLKKVLNLPKTVPGEQLKINKKDPDINLIPIDLYMCASCKHVQLIHVPNFKNLWGKDYTFKPSDNPELINHFKKTVNFLKKNYLKKINFAFEIGSNDGIFLKEINNQFKSKVLGIDPSDEPVKIAKKNNIPTIKDYFDFNISKKIKKKYGSPDLIIANNVFAHMDDMRSIVKGIDHLLEENGYFIFEASYLLDVVKKFLIGTIIHEHISVHSLHSLKPFLANFNLHLIGIRHVSKIQGGAIIGIAIKSKSKIKSNIIKKFIEIEKNSGITSVKNFENYNKVFHSKINIFKDKISNKSTKFDIIGYGAARSAPLIIDLLGIRNKMKFIIDDNPRKSGKYLSIGNIPINSFSISKSKLQNTLIVILGWAQTERIIVFLKKNKIKCYVATIFPKFQIKKI